MPITKQEEKIILVINQVTSYLQAKDDNFSATLFEVHDLFDEGDSSEELELEIPEERTAALVSLLKSEIDLVLEIQEKARKC